jgi:hypothetical protein
MPATLPMARHIAAIVVHLAATDRGGLAGHLVAADPAGSPDRRSADVSGTSPPPVVARQIAATWPDQGPPLKPGYVRSEIDRLSFGAPPPGTVPDPTPTAPAGANVPPVCQDPLLALIGASWPGQEPAGVRGLPMVGVAGFEPTTSCSQIHSDRVARGGPRLQAAERISDRSRSAFQRSQAVAPNRSRFVPSHVPSAARSLTLAALRDLHGRRRLLTVAEVASALAISTASVYTLCTTGRLRHIRVLNQIRISPDSILGLLARDR